ncbi:hypothetical protein [Streptomyces lunaelactis]|uniref:hypothetical protein n=1 Tax=Streptomyces lunaelactis TaxID=1535768 RepID=UPI00359F3A78
MHAYTAPTVARWSWIQYLGVLERSRGRAVARSRGRGVASHLLRHAFGVCAARGRDTIGLGVDTGNATGALWLYEAHGMALHCAADTWEVTRRADPPIRRLVRTAEADVHVVLVWGDIWA